MSTMTRDGGAAYAPFMVINPGETLTAAMGRHRQDTGHRGGLIVVGWNRSGRPECQVFAQGARAAA